MESPIHMDDPILRAYRVPNNVQEPIEGDGFVCFDVSGFFSPIGIRDQIIRACSVVERAFVHHLISPDRPLLIVGAGHAGIAAALKAFDLNVPTVLVDKGKALGQLGEAGRFVSLLQYDWSAAHWTKTRFPWEDEPEIIKVFINDGTAAQTASDLWRQFVGKRDEGRDRLFLHENTILDTFSFARDSAEDFPRLFPKFRKVNRRTGEMGGERIAAIPSFGMGLSCTGFGKEKVFLDPTHKFWGFEYWKLDKYDFAEEESLLIAGSGDGALQDFLLMTTHGISAKEIYNRLNLSTSTKLSIENVIFKAEEQLRRDEIWWTKKTLPNESINRICVLYQKIHQHHLTLVNALLNGDETVFPNLTDDDRKISDSIGNLLRPGALENVSLVHICNHFEAYYPLNRFLALLIGEFIKRQANREVFIPFNSVANVESADITQHVCDRNVNECAQFEHHVKLNRQATCLNFQGKSDDSYSITYRNVFLRFGLNGQGLAKVFKGRPALPGLQILPNNLP